MIKPYGTTRRLSYRSVNGPGLTPFGSDAT